MPSAHQVRLAAIMADLPVLTPHRHEGECSCTPTVALIRVSSIKTRKVVESPKIQFREICKYADENNLKVIDIRFEIDKSGAVEEEDRPELQKIVADIRAGRYFHITVWNMSRWGRNARVALNVLHAVNQAGGDVASATEKFDLTTAKGERDLNQALVDAQAQSRAIGEGWRGAQENRREDHLPHSGRRRFGYDYVDKEYVVNRAEAALLEKAYTDYVAGKSMGQIARHFKESGSKTTLDGEWTKQGLARTMDTGFAAGLIRERSTTRTRHGAKLRPGNSIRDYDVWRPGKHTAIISEATWEKYKDRRTRQAELPPRSRKPTHELSSLLICGICARRMITKYSGRSSSHQWTCSWRAELHPGQAVSISNAFALKIVKDWLSERTQPEWVEAASEEAFEKLKASQPQNDDLNDKLAKLRKRVEAVDELILEARSTGNDARAARYISNLDGLEKQVRDLEEQIAALPKARAPRDFRRFAPVLERWDEFPKEVHREALGTVLAMLVVGPAASSTTRLEAARERLTFVELDDLPLWADWLVSRKHKSA